MKAKLYSVVAAAALCGATATFGFGGKSQKADVTVEFLEPENFTDFRITQMGGKSEQASLESELKEEINRAGQRYLPPNYQLKLRFRDIDMAGDFEPWRVRLQDTRIVRDIYPPRLSVEYVITDATGNVVGSGERTLTDLTFQMRLRMPNPSNRDTQVEAEMVSDFIREITRPLA